MTVAPKRRSYRRSCRPSYSFAAFAGAGSGVLHGGAVAGFPMPVLRYFVGGASGPAAAASAGDLHLLQPADEALVTGPADFSWAGTPAAALYRLELSDAAGQPVLSALLQPGVGAYRAPSWLREKAPGGQVRWRVVALGPTGESVAETVWRGLRLAAP